MISLSKMPNYNYIVLRCSYSPKNSLAAFGNAALEAYNGTSVVEYDTSALKDMNCITNPKFMQNK